MCGSIAARKFTIPASKTVTASTLQPHPGDKDGLNFNANVGVGPYSVVILSQ